CALPICSASRRLCSFLSRASSCTLRLRSSCSAILRLNSSAATLSAFSAFSASISLTSCMASWFSSSAVIRLFTCTSSFLFSFPAIAFRNSLYWSLMGFLLLLDKCFQVVLVLHLSAHMELVGRSWFSVSWFDELPHVSRCAAGVSSPLFSSHTSLASCAIVITIYHVERLINLVCELI